MTEIETPGADPRRVILIDANKGTLETVHLAEPTVDCLMRTFAGEDPKHKPFLSGKDGWPGIWMLCTARASKSADEIMREREARGVYDPARPLLGFNLTPLKRLLGDDREATLVFDCSLVLTGEVDRDGNLLALPDDITLGLFEELDEVSQWEGVFSFEPEVVVKRDNLTADKVREIPELLDTHAQDLLDFMDQTPGSDWWKRAKMVSEKLSDYRKSFRQMMVTRLSGGIDAPFDVRELWAYDKLAVKAMQDCEAREKAEDPEVTTITPLSFFHAVYEAKFADPDASRAKGMALLTRQLAQMGIPLEQVVRMVREWSRGAAE